MGKKIDRAVLDILLAAAFYLYFHHAFKSRLLSAALAMLCLVLLRRIGSRTVAILRNLPPLRRRSLRRNARGAIMTLACMDEPAARAAAERIIALSYGEEAPVLLVQRHPSCDLQPEGLFELWRQNRTAGRIVVCASCKASPDCRALAAELKLPQVALIDAPLLAQLIAEHPGILQSQPDSPSQPRTRRAARILHLLLCRKNAPRCLLVAASMFIFYLLSGSLVHFILSMGLILMAILSLRTPPRPARLF